MAVIVGKDPQGNTIIKSLNLPPTDEELERAKQLEKLLSRRIPEIETKLQKTGLLSKTTPPKGKIATGGSVELWYKLGKELQPIADDRRLLKLGELKWLWGAIRQHASSRIQRRDRGGSRLHFDYCYRVSKLPWDCVKRFHWDDWVYLLDSRSFRGEPRADAWIQNRVETLKLLTRDQLRKMVQQLNASFKRKEASVYDNDELFAKYDEALESVTRASPNSTSPGQQESESGESP